MTTYLTAGVESPTEKLAREMRMLIEKARHETSMSIIASIGTADRSTAVTLDAGSFEAVVDFLQVTYSKSLANGERRLLAEAIERRTEGDGSTRELVDYLLQLHAHLHTFRLQAQVMLQRAFGFREQNDRARVLALIRELFTVGPPSVTPAPPKDDSSAANVSVVDASAGQPATEPQQPSTASELLRRQLEAQRVAEEEAMRSIVTKTIGGDDPMTIIRNI